MKKTQMMLSLLATLGSVGNVYAAGGFTMEMFATHSGPIQVGSTVQISYKFTNTGDVSISSPQLTLFQYEGKTISPIAQCQNQGNLLPGASVTDCIQIVTVTSQDMADSVLNFYATADSYDSSQVQYVAQVSGGLPVSQTSGGGSIGVGGTSPSNTAPASTSTQTMASAINNLCGSESVDTALAATCSQWNRLSGAAQVDATRQITPEQLVAQSDNSVTSSFTQISNIQSRLGELRREGNSGTVRSASFRGLKLAMNGADLPVGQMADEVTDDYLVNSGRLGTYINGRIEVGGRDTTAQVIGSEFSTKGITIGADYRVTPQIVIGASVGYANTSNDYEQNRGDMDSDGNSVSFYGSYYTANDFYMDLIANYGRNNYDMMRHIMFGGIDTRANGSTNSKQTGMSFSFGKDITFNEWSINPYARIEYVSSTIDAYSETNNMGLALAYGSQKVTSLQTALATRISKVISAESGVYMPSAHLEWEQQHKNDQRVVSGHFVADPSTAFSFYSDKPDHQYFRLGGSLSATWTAGRSGFVSAETVLANDNMWSRRLQFGFRKEF